MKLASARHAKTIRDLAIAGLLAVISGILALGILLWRPADAHNDPYAATVARWTVEDIADSGAFIGVGVFVYRPNWAGPAQTFAGPVLLSVDDAQDPVRISFDGQVAVHRASDGGSPELTTGGAVLATANEATLQAGDLVAVPEGTSFTVATGNSEVVRLSAIAILPDGPPATLGIQQVEWRAWGDVKPAPKTPLTVTISDIFLGGDERYSFQRFAGPALVSMEGSGDGAQSIALTVTKGRAVYEKIADVPPWNLATAVSLLADQSPTTANRERALDARSGAYLPTGGAAILHNRSLVDGTDVRLVTFDAGQ